MEGFRILVSGCDSDKWRGTVRPEAAGEEKKYEYFEIKTKL